MTATTDLTTQIYQVFIKASPEQIWAAITTPGYTAPTSTAPGSRSLPIVTSPTARTGRRGETGRCWNSIRPGGWCTNGAP